MTRAEYILIKKSNPVNIVYEYYKEFANGKLLNYQEFFIYINAMSVEMLKKGIYGDLINDLYRKVSRHYDNQFKVCSLLNREGDIIGYV